MNETNMSTTQATTSEGGSVEKGISGDYEFSIRAVISEAWDKTNGSKWPIQLAFLYYFLVILAFIIVIVGVTIAFNGSTPATEPSMGDSMLFEFILQIAFNLILLPMIMGILMMGIHRSVDRPISANSVFAYFPKMLKLFVTTLLMYLMIMIGFMLLILPGIYLMVSYYMALPLVIEKNMGPWEALETSRKTVSHHWFRMVAFFIIMGFIYIISIIPLGIGLIWTLPLFMISYGIIYRNMFGVES